jgi:hypothetical protein
MNPEIQRYLDGDIELSALPRELRAQAEAWDALLGAERADAAAPPWLESRIMSQVHALPAHSRWRGALDWLVAAHSIRIRPITVFASGFALVLLALLAGRATSPSPIRTMALNPAAPAPGTAAHPVVYVQFALAAREASSVSVAGDFTDWDPSRVKLQDQNGDGVWTATVAVPPGNHKYMFVVDGKRWVTDPRAERYADDGFGMKNALIAVANPVENPS